MKKILCFIAAALSFFGTVLSQTITHGPFTGAVTHNSARAYVRTNTATAFDFIISVDSTSFSAPINYAASTDAAKDTSAIIAISGLQPDTKYYYKININGLQAGAVQSFRTFPIPNSVSDFSFAFGSCDAFSTTITPAPIFDLVINSSPRFFLQCGDWGYPDFADNFPANTNFFSLDNTKIQESYHLKYSPQADIFNLMKRVPIDYVYDDHDYMNDNSARDYTPDYHSSPGVLVDYSNPPAARINSIKAYTDFFPGYPMIDTTEGIFHSFRYGNVEIFMCDNRSARSAPLECLVPDSANASLIQFDPPPGHSILGQAQMDWLINGLKNSSARWKFIVTGVAFNKAYKQYLDFALNPFVQNYVFTSPYGAGTGKNFAGGIVDGWVGFPEDQDRLLNACFYDSITNVIFLTSDSHTAAIDDGGNGGFPEIMSGNLNQSNSKLAHLTDSLGMNVWNVGGQGLGGNNNFSCTFGNIEVFGNDSVRLCIIDTLGTAIACLTVHDGMLNTPTTISEISPVTKKHAFIISPNPAKNFIRIRIKNTELLGKKAQMEIQDYSGKIVSAESVSIQKEMQVNTSDISQGFYFCILTVGKQKFVEKFFKGN